MIAATFVLQANEIGEFVDAFLSDHGGIHVGEEQPLAPALGELDHDIDRRAGEREPYLIGDRPKVSAGVGREGKVGCDALIQPNRPGHVRQHLRGARQKGIGERRAFQGSRPAWPRGWLRPRGLGFRVVQDRVLQLHSGPGVRRFRGIAG